MVYEPITNTGESNGKLERDIAYEKAFELLQKNDPLALETFEKLAVERPQDPLVGLHLKRLQSGEQGDIIIMEEK
jgi:adenylate cyclase